MGTVGAFSFYYSKNLGAYGEGGMVTTNNPTIARQLRMMRDHGSEKRYIHEQLGLNGRLDELQAAVLRIKLRHLDEWNEKRHQAADIYNQALAEIDVTTPLEASGNCHVYHLYVIRTRHREALRQHLNEHGIGTGIHYPVPVHLQKSCSHCGLGMGSLPVTESAANEVLSLPMYAELSHEQIQRVVTEIQNFLLNP